MADPPVAGLGVDLDAQAVAVAGAVGQGEGGCQHRLAELRLQQRRVAPDPAAVGTQGRDPGAVGELEVAGRGAGLGRGRGTGSEPVLAHGPSTLRRRASAWEQPATRSSTSPSTA